MFFTLEPLRRYATLTAPVLELTATLTDEALNMFEHLVGQLFRRSERAHAEQFHASGKSINEKVRLYARVGQALIKARSSGGDVFAAIEAVLPWSKFESTVAEAQTLAQPEEFDYLALLDERYSSVRKFAPLLLAHFEFHAAPAAAELLQARMQGTGENIARCYARRRGSAHRPVAQEHSGIRRRLR